MILFPPPGIWLLPPKWCYWRKDSWNLIEGGQCERPQEPTAQKDDGLIPKERFNAVLKGVINVFTLTLGIG